MNLFALLVQLLPEAVLVITALLILAVAVVYESKSGRIFPIPACISLTTVGILISGGLCFISHPVGKDALLLAVDPLARLSKPLVLGMGLIAVWLPPARREIRHAGEFYALLLFALTGLILVVGTNHLLFLFVSLELADLSLYLLAGFSQTRRAAEASLKYFLFGGVSAAFLLFGMSFLYGFSGSATLEGMAMALATGPVPVLAVVGLAMVLVGLAFKMAAAPFHYWAPDVYQGAPITTVALVSAASKLAGIVVMVRILMIGFPAVVGSAAWGTVVPGWSVWLAVLAAVSMLVGNYLAFAQKSVRRLLGYSAVANTGYLLVALAANGAAAAGAALFYGVVYGLATLGAFAVTAAVERERGDDSSAAFAGLIHRAPFQAMALFACFASLAGIPPLAGFVGKFALFSTALSTAKGTGVLWLVALAVTMSAVSLYYYLAILKQAFVRDCADDMKSVRLSAFHILAIGIPTFLLVILGLFPSLLLAPITHAVIETLGSR